MNKKIIGLLVALLAGSPSFAADKTAKGSHDFEVSKNLDIFNSLYKELDMFYVDTIAPEKTVQNGIYGMLSMTDPYTTYFPESEMGDLKFMTTGSYAGVGAVISQTKDKKINISEIYEGKPAYKAGLKAGDVFVSIDGVTTDGKTTSDVSKMLRGEPLTSAKVVVKRPGVAKEITVNIVREKIVIDPIVYSGMLNSKVGYIKIADFTDQAYSSFSSAFNNLKQKNMQSLVIDLRSNPGGLLSEAVRIINMFVPRGSKLVYTKGKEKKWDSEYIAKESPVDTNIPIVVLVNRNSASAAEIVSGSLQDLDRAVILGERTYGKGLVQTTRDLPYGGSLKVTISKYYIPSGRCIQAIDYAKRNDEGLVERIPDSLTHVFHTVAGREVRDGCGISPDYTFKEEKFAPVLYHLIGNNLIFNYVTKYQSVHSTIAKPGDFVFDDFEGLKKFVAESAGSDTAYKLKSSELLKSLIEAAKTDGYYDNAKSTFDSLTVKLKPNLLADMDANKEQVCKMVSEEIIRRYYYQKGVAQQSLKSDKAAAKAVELLENKDEFNALLTAKVVGKNDETDNKEEKK